MASRLRLIASTSSLEQAAKEAVMTTAKLADVVEATAIRPFQVNVPESDLAELMRACGPGSRALGRLGARADAGTDSTR